MNGSNRFEREWENILNPQLLKTNLIAASLYITAFETLKGRIIDRLKDFFLEWDENGNLKPSNEYKTEVLDRNRNVLYASLLWHVDMEVINLKDLESFERIKSYRNLLAHELPSFIVRGVTSEYELNFSEMITLLSKIETWWIANFEIPVNADFDGVEIDTDSIIPGSVLMLNLMLKLALGSDEEALELYNSIRDTEPTSL